MLLTSLYIALIAMSPFAPQGKYNPVLKAGDAAPSWSELPGVDDETYSFADFEEQEVLVVAFTCNSCPYAVDYEDRMIELRKKYSTEKLGIIAINVNKKAVDRLEAMKVRAEEKGFNFPYVFDESQQSAKDYGATYTPEFFVLNKERRIVYMGAFDDDTNADEVERNYVIEAIEAAFKGETPEVEETVAIGCRVQIERSRRDR